jgi:hypothetical protein
MSSAGFIPCRCSDSKSEARNPKSETNQKSKKKQTNSMCSFPHGRFGRSCFGFASDFVLAISGFGAVVFDGA